MEERKDHLWKVAEEAEQRLDDLDRYNQPQIDVGQFSPGRADHLLQDPQRGVEVAGEEREVNHHAQNGQQAWQKPGGQPIGPALF